MIYYAQFGEDRDLAALFGPDHVGYCVEVGANDGHHGSNTLYFEQRGWECVLVEPNPILCDKLRQERKGRVFQCGASDHEGEATLLIAQGADHADGVSMIGDNSQAHARIAGFGFSSRAEVVQLTTLDKMLAEAAIDRPLDFVSIDVEGLELAVLRGFDVDRWSPRILLIEDNAGFQDTAVSDHLSARGYVSFRRTGVNDWYARRDDHDLVTSAALQNYADARSDGLRVARQQQLRVVARRIPGLRTAIRALRRLAG